MIGNSNIFLMFDEKIVSNKHICICFILTPLMHLGTKIQIYNIQTFKQKKRNITNGMATVYNRALILVPCYSLNLWQKMKECQLTKWGKKCFVQEVLDFTFMVTKLHTLRKLKALSKDLLLRLSISCTILNGCNFIKSNTWKRLFNIYIFFLNFVYLHAVKCLYKVNHNMILRIDGLEQDCSNSSALTMELLQFCTKPSIWSKW